MLSFAEAAKQTIAAATSATAASNDNTAWPTRMTTTWNGAVSHAETGSARVDLFFGALRDISNERLTELMDASYAEDALHTLKIVAYVRDCRGGKGERQVGRYALEWLAQHQPEALAHNLKHYIGEYGRFDDPVALMNTKVESTALELLQHQLKQDLATLESDAHKSISLCAKWIPSENKALDKKLQMNKKLARHMKIQPAELRKKYLSPLRKRLQLLERDMCAKEWDKIDFNKVPSVAMRIHGKPNMAFERHMKEKFTQWKASLASGKTKVNAKVLFPHEVVAQYMYGSHRSKDDLLEAQWQVLVEQAATMGNMHKTLVLSDVSGSMSGRPMEVSIALGLLISSLAQDAYKDLVLTFESQPKFHNVHGESLYDRVKILERAPWGGTTDFCAAFYKILDVAKQAKLTPDQMAERLIVVSDMQFNMADRSFETNYQVLQRAFTESGYNVPHLVFWNVNGQTRDFPTYSGQAKVSLVSGFSSAILKSVLTGTDITPFQTMLNVVIDARYDLITLPSAPTVETSASTPEDDDAVLL